MSAPQGLFEFPGVQSLLSAQVTVSHGVSPSVATIVTGKPPSGPGRGTLTLRYGSATIRFFDCRVDRVDIGVDDSGRTTYTWTILDRRWLWRRCGSISGFYNVRKDDNQIQPGTEKTLAELVTMCLNEMGEKNYDITAIAALKLFPEVGWEFSNPAEELARLLDMAHAIIVLAPNNKVRVCKIGVGKSVPSNGILDGSVSLDPPDPPEGIRIVGARTRWQMDLPLEAVGPEFSGELKLIDQLSYTPVVDGVKTWKFADVEHFHCLENKQLKQFAQRYIFRMYRIKMPIRISTGIQPNFALAAPQKVDYLWQILPLENSQVIKYEQAVPGSDKPELLPLPPWVWGKWWDGAESHKPPEPDPLAKIKNKPAGLYNRGFTVDVERGLVMFSEPVRLRNGEENGRTNAPAQLYLRISFGVREKKSRAWHHFTHEKKLTNGRAGYWEHVHHEDIVRQIWKDPDTLATLDNRGECETQANYYLQQALLKYQTIPTGSLTYAGFLPLALDGAIHQVSYVLSSSGFAYTKVSRNKEEPAFAPTYAERREYEHQAAARRFFGQSPRVIAARAKKMRG